MKIIGNKIDVNTIFTNHLRDDEYWYLRDFMFRNIPFNKYISCFYSFDIVEELKNETRKI